MVQLGVVVPVYNVEKYVSECIESIINQTYQQLEIILVDDGSTDNSGSICDEYAKKDVRIKVIHQKNQGPSHARYAGVVAAESEYVTFVDADDWLDLHAYEQIVSYIKEEVDMVTYGIIRYQMEGTQFEDLNAIKAGEYARADIEKKIIPTMLWDADLHVWGLDPSLCNKVVKKELWLKQLIKVKELQIHFNEDAAVAYPMIMNMNYVIILDKCLYYHRLRADDEYPNYLKDEQFFDKLFRLYLYLKEIFKNDLSLMRELEYFYLHSIEVRLRIYGERRQRNTYTFPFDMVEKDSKVVLYGAGTVGQEFHRQVKQIGYCEIKLWVDMNYEKYLNYDVNHPEKIVEIESFDYVVIANASKCTADEIRKYLLNLGVEEVKILWTAKSTGGK